MGFFVGLPGSEIPKWFSYEDPRSSMDIRFPFGCFNSMFLGFAFSAILSFEVPVFAAKILLNCKCNFKNVKGGDRDFSIIEYLPPVTVLESDHLFLWYKHYTYSDDLCNVKEATFTFTAELLNYNFDQLECEKYKLKVKSCGVHLMYGNEEVNKCKPSRAETSLSLQCGATNPNFKESVLETESNDKNIRQDYLSSNQTNAFTGGRSACEKEEPLCLNVSSSNAEDGCSYNETMLPFYHYLWMS